MRGHQGTFTGAKPVSALKRATVGLLLAPVTAGLALVGSTAPAHALVAPCSADNFAGGDGTLANPFRVATAAQLAAINTAGCPLKNYVQTADIDLTGVTWTPIGSSLAFGGTFYGGCHVIDNLTVTGSFGVGLFKQTARATLLSMRLTNVSVTGTSANVGGLVGTASSNTTISDVSVTGTVRGGGTPVSSSAHSARRP